MTLPESTPPSTPTPTAVDTKGTQCGTAEAAAAAAAADDGGSVELMSGYAPPVLSSASRSTSLSGSRRTSDLGDTMAMLGDEGDEGVRSSGRMLGEYGYGGASTPMREIMDGATVPTLPRYIFKAHEMTQGVRDLLQVRLKLFFYFFYFLK